MNAENVLIHIKRQLNRIVVLSGNRIFNSWSAPYIGRWYRELKSLEGAKTVTLPNLRRRFTIRLVVTALILIPQALIAQNAESLRTQIEVHYAAIHSDDIDTVLDHHLPEMTIFPQSGHILMEAGWEESGVIMGAEVPFPATQVVMRHFSAQIYGDVGIATFYLDGSYGDERGTWRVTAVWVWRNGQWLEAHHHESRLVS